MSALNRRDDALWRTAARPDEAARVAAIDARLDVLAFEQKRLARARNDITNRCCQRARGWRIALATRTDGGRDG